MVPFAIRLEAIATRFEAIAIMLEAIAFRLEAIAISCQMFLAVTGGLADSKLCAAWKDGGRRNRHKDSSIS